MYFEITVKIGFEPIAIILLCFSDDRHAPPTKKSKNDDDEEEDLNDANYDEVCSIIRKKGYIFLYFKEKLKFLDNFELYSYTIPLLMPIQS